jgi:hypothetical protein
MACPAGVRYEGGNRSMAQSSATPPDDPVSAELERIPLMQRVADNPFLLLFVGVAAPTIFYLLWGLMDIILIPIAKS